MMDLLSWLADPSAVVAIAALPFLLLIDHIEEGLRTALRLARHQRIRSRRRRERPLPVGSGEVSRSCTSTGAPCIASRRHTAWFRKQTPPATAANLSSGPTS